MSLELINISEWYRPKLAKEFILLCKYVVEVSLAVSANCQHSFFTGDYSQTVNDAKVAIELQPHFLKAFVRGKS